MKTSSVKNVKIVSSMKNLIQCGWILLFVCIAGGCFNTNRTPVEKSEQDNSSVLDESILDDSEPGSSLSFSITSAQTQLPTTEPGSNENSNPEIQVFFNAVTQTTLRDVCQEQSDDSENNNSGKACKCRFTWTETNKSDSTTITRTEDTNPKQITSFQVTCTGLTAWNEIVENTIVKVSLVPAPGNSASFSTNSYSMVKQSSTSTGDFRDSEGNSYKNIYHYVCFDKFQKPLTIGHAVRNAAEIKQTAEFIPASVANDFEFGTPQDPNTNPFSAQSYYYDFYVRSNEPGSIDASNADYTCPQVNVNGTPSFFPMDTTFSLSLNSSSKFNIKVTARTKITANENENVLGYAATPNADGTCPVFTLSNGKVQASYRLRQYKAVYPLRYQASGKVADLSQPYNLVYVLDRPVHKLGGDPFKPITRLGPKPCPFSFKTAQFGQKCMSDASLAGWNIDGTQIDGDPTCPIYPPVKDKHLKDDGTLVIRPYKPFTPHFLENTSFKACAFPSSSPVDPEIVVIHDDNAFPSPPGPNDFYCAKHYPPAGAIISSAFGDSFDKAPGDCDLASSAQAIKTDKTYACSRTYNPTNSTLDTPQAGCCQICAGTDCSAQGGGTTADGRNAAFSPPQDAGNPAVGMKVLPRAIPNQSGGGGCFDPSED